MKGGLASVPQLRKGVLEFCVLAELDSRPAYTMELGLRLAARGQLLGTAQALYPLLVRLRRQGLVEDRVEASRIGPPRRYYALTSAGRESLDEFRSTWIAFTSSVDAVLALTHGAEPLPSAAAIQGRIQ